MERVNSPSLRSLMDTATGTPVARGASLGLALLILERFLVPFDTALVGVLFLALGLVLAIEGHDWWPQAGRTLTALGLVFLVSRFVDNLLQFRLVL
ncbi:MAG: hypothetical protein ABEJ05_12235 [Haloglomus sp.]